MAGKYKIEKFVGKAGKHKGKFYYRLKAPNGEVMQSGEAVDRRSSRDRAAQNLADAFKPDRVRLVDLDPPAPLKPIGKSPIAKPAAAKAAKAKGAPRVKPGTPDAKRKNATLAKAYKSVETGRTSGKRPNRSNTPKVHQRADGTPTESPAPGDEPLPTAEARAEPVEATVVSGQMGPMIPNTPAETPAADLADSDAKADEAADAIESAKDPAPVASKHGDEA